jgi:hypothetical protein
MGLCASDEVSSDLGWQRNWALALRMFAGAKAQFFRRSGGTICGMTPDAKQDNLWDGGGVYLNQDLLLIAGC